MGTVYSNRLCSYYVFVNIFSGFYNMLTLVIISNFKNSDISLEEKNAMRYTIENRVPDYGKNVPDAYKSDGNVTETYLKHMKITVN